MIKNIVQDEEIIYETQYYHKRLMDMFESRCKKLEMWYDPAEVLFRTQETRHITKYNKEISIA